MEKCMYIYIYQSRYQLGLKLTYYKFWKISLLSNESKFFIVVQIVTHLGGQIHNNKYILVRFYQNLVWWYQSRTSYQRMVSYGLPSLIARVL